MTALLAKAGHAGPICSSMTWPDAAVVIAAGTRERNQAHLVRCSAGCGALVWLAGSAAPDHRRRLRLPDLFGPSERRNGVKKCEATNEAGAKCLFTEHADTIRHLWPEDKDRDSFDLGKLQEAVRGFLERGASREHLARILVETEEGR